jgi:hypothetical protein
MRLAQVLCIAGLLLLGAPVARSQDRFETNSGGSYSGTLLSNDGTSVEIETTQGAKLKLPYEQLTPMTQYRLELAKTTEEGASQLALADWCVGRKLYEQARIHFRKALTVAPLMEEEIKTHLVAARKTAADELLARGKGLQAEGKNQEARQVLSALVQELPLEEASKEAATLLASETTQRKEAVLKRPVKSAAGKAPAGNAPMRADGEPFSEPTRLLFEPVVDSYRKMLDATQDGLRKGSNSGEKDYEKAIKEGDKIRKAAEKLQKQSGGEAEVAEALELVGLRLEEAEVDARINLANDYLIRTSYNNALEAVNLGLVNYPRNERLQQMRGQVGAASASNGGGDWIIVGGRR